jgi:hypothetical protein
MHQPDISFGQLPGGSLGRAPSAWIPEVKHGNGNHPFNVNPGSINPKARLLGRYHISINSWLLGEYLPIVNKPGFIDQSGVAIIDDFDDFPMKNSSFSSAIFHCHVWLPEDKWIQMVYVSLHRYLGVRVCRWQRRENEVVHRFQGPPPKHAGIGSIFLIKII